MRAEDRRDPAKVAFLRYHAALVATKKRERRENPFLFQVAYKWHNQDNCWKFCERVWEMHMRKLHRRNEQLAQHLRRRRQLRNLELVAKAGIIIATLVLATLFLSNCGYPCDQETIDVCLYGNGDMVQIERVKDLVERSMDERVGQVTVNSVSDWSEDPYDHGTGELYIDFGRGCRIAYRQLVHGFLHITAEHRGVNGHRNHDAPGLFEQMPEPTIERAFRLSAGGMCR